MSFAIKYKYRRPDYKLIIIWYNYERFIDINDLFIITFYCALKQHNIKIDVTFLFQYMVHNYTLMNRCAWIILTRRYKFVNIVYILINFFGYYCARCIRNFAREQYLFSDIMVIKVLISAKIHIIINYSNRMNHRESIK